MVRIDVLIREDQEVALGKIPGTTSELIRQAIDDLIKKLTPQAIASPSKKKGGKNGS